MVLYRTFERLEKYVDIDATGFDFRRNVRKPEIYQHAPVISHKNIARRQISVNYSCSMQPSNGNTGFSDQFRGKDFF